jgi:hypothetical protein
VLWRWQRHVSNGMTCAAYAMQWWQPLTRGWQLLARPGMKAATRIPCGSQVMDPEGKVYYYSNAQ